MWKQIKRAMRERKEISISLPLPDGRAEVRTLEGGPPWAEAMLVQVRVRKRGIDWVQTFGGMEEAVEELEKEAGYERD